jgi:hypothetical protein
MSQQSVHPSPQLPTVWQVQGEHDSSACKDIMRPVAANTNNPIPKANLPNIIVARIMCSSSTLLPSCLRARSLSSVTQESSPRLTASMPPRTPLVAHLLAGRSTHRELAHPAPPRWLAEFCAICTQEMLWKGPDCGLPHRDRQRYGRGMSYQPYSISQHRTVVRRCCPVEQAHYATPAKWHYKPHNPLRKPGLPFYARPSPRRSPRDFPPDPFLRARGA